MNDGAYPLHVLITSASQEAEGGIVALHRTLFGQPVRRKFRVSMFPVSSPHPFREGSISRVLRVAAGIGKMIALLAKDRSIEVVHINTSYDAKGMARDSFFAMVSRLFGKKTVLQIHSAVGAGPTAGFTEWIARRTFSLCDRILVLSRRDRERLVRVPEGKVEVIPNAVSTRDFAGNGLDGKPHFSIPADGKVVLFVSRLIEDKGVYVLIESIPAVVGRIPGVYFLFAGEGPERKRMEEICREKGLEESVRFAGHLRGDDLLRAFSCADVFVFPSCGSEGMPMAILQALAAGLPIVTTPLGAIPEIVEDGVHGFFVEPNAPDQLSERIVFLLDRENLRKRMEGANRVLAGKEYDREALLDRLERFYISLSNGRFN